MVVHGILQGAGPVLFDHPAQVAIGEDAGQTTVRVEHQRSAGTAGCFTRHAEHIQNARAALDHGKLLVLAHDLRDAHQAPPEGTRRMELGIIRALKAPLLKDDHGKRVPENKHGGG